MRRVARAAWLRSSGAAAAVAWRLAWPVAVGLLVPAALLVAGHMVPSGALLGAIGLAAILRGTRGDKALWHGMLVAAVSWTAAWALSTG